jgi:hypothetical protein
MKVRGYLFANGELQDWLRARLREARKAAQAIPPDRVLGIPEPDLVRELVDRYSVNPPRLNLDQRYSPGAHDIRVSRAILGHSRLVYVPGTRVEVRVPFDGDPELFHLRPSKYTAPPRGRVEGQELVVWHEAAADSLDQEQVKAQLDRELDLIQKYLGWVSADCTNFNDDLQREIEQAVKQRRTKVLQDRNLEAFLGIPVLRRSDASPVFSVPVQPRQRPASALGTRPPATQPFAPEPAIAPEDYAEILAVVRTWRDLVERLPRTFGPMSEEILRDILLVVLNNQFGPAGAEVFSRRGKTDIFIWHEKGAVFVAECKFWGGSRVLEKAIDQLLSYLVWRDTKAALILCVREANVSEITRKADEVFKTHRLYKRREPDVASFPVYVLHHAGDPNREIKVALVMVPLPRERSGE